MPRGDRSTATRDALLKAGARVFVRRSLKGTTVREIVEEAGLTIPVLYYHFSGKEELYAAVIAEGRAQFRALLEAALGEKGDAVTRLRRVALAHVHFGREDPIRLRLLCSELFRAPGCGEPVPAAGELNLWTREQMRGLFTAADDAGELSVRDPNLAERLFTALLAGLMIEQARDPDKVVLDDDLAEHVVRTFCGGIGGEAPAARGRPRARVVRLHTRPRAVNRRTAPRVPPNRVIE